MSILVTGGAGHIGSVTVERLKSRGDRVIVLDDPARGHRESIDPDVPFHHGSAGDRALVERLVKEHQVDACVHFAALSYVGESVEKPALYFENNVSQGISLVGALVDAGVPICLFLFVHSLRRARKNADWRRLSPVAEESLRLDQIHIGAPSRDV